MRRVGLDRETSSGAVPRGVARLGLVPGMTGVPLFVLFLEEAVAPFHFELRSLEKAETMRERAGTACDTRAWKHVEAFFLAGGQRAHVLALRLAGGDRLSAMLGVEAGIARRTGIQCVRDWAEKADLLSIPQATELLSQEDYTLFCQKVFELAPETGMLFLVDLPKALDAVGAAGFTQKWFCSDAATFHPWFLVAGETVPPSAVLAAWLQKADVEVGIQEMASQMPLVEGVAPVVELSPSERRTLMEARINTCLLHAGQARVWGGYTLADQADWRARLIPLRRSSLKIRQAVEQICEPYVLEAAGDELPVWVENSLQNFLRSVRRIFHRDLQDPFTTSVKVVTQDGEERILVNLQYALPHSLEKFSFSFVA